MHCRIYTTSQRGVSLVEALVTLVIVSISMLAVMSLLTRSIAGRNADLQQLRTLRAMADDGEQADLLQASQLRVPAQSGGFTLIELMVAMTIGLVITAGAMHMFSMAISAWRTVESVASLEERMAFAMQAISDDVLLAGYTGVAPLAAPFTPVTAQCGGADVSGWALAIDQPIESVNNLAGLPCPLFNAAQIGSDGLIVRHHDPFSDAPVLQMHGWYVDRASSLPGQPSLRRQTLMPNGAVQNHEIIPGVENMQVQLGIDSDADYLVDAWVNENISADPVLMVQVELRIRSALREGGAGGDGFRRVTARRQFFLRNATG